MKVHLRVLRGTPERDISQVLLHPAIASWGFGEVHNSECEARELLAYMRDYCGFSGEQISRAVREIEERGWTELESESLVEADIKRGLQCGERDLAGALIAAARSGS